MFMETLPKPWRISFMPFGKDKEIIDDCLDDLQSFIDEVIPKEESESGTDFSEDNYIEQISEFLAWN